MKTHSKEKLSNIKFVTVHLPFYHVIGKKILGLNGVSNLESINLVSMKPSNVLQNGSFYHKKVKSRFGYLISVFLTLNPFLFL